MIPPDPAPDRRRSPDVLVAVDDTVGSRHAAEAAARHVAPHDDQRVVLFHLLPTLPTELLEFGGRQDPEAEKAGLAALKRRRHDWMERRADEQARPLLDSLRDLMVESGVDRQRIDTCYDAPNPECTVPGEILRIAKERDCGTVFVGRNSYPGYRELFHKHVGEELLDQTEDEPIEVAVIAR